MQVFVTGAGSESRRNQDRHPKNRFRHHCDIPSSRTTRAAPFGRGWKPSASTWVTYACPPRVTAGGSDRNCSTNANMTNINTANTGTGKLTLALQKFQLGEAG